MAHYFTGPITTVAGPVMLFQFTASAANACAIFRPPIFDGSIGERAE